MTLHAITMRLLKNNWSLLTVVVILVGAWVFIGNRNSTGIDTSTARAYWKSRDSSLGAHNRIVTNKSDFVLIADFPELASFDYDLASEFYSANGIGMDLILQKQDALELINSIKIGEIGINQIELVERNGKKWVVGLFDSGTAKSANGYYFEQKELLDRYWISILKIL